MVQVVLRSEHPSAHLHEAMSETLWEALAAAAVEHGLLTVPEESVADRLVTMGLLFCHGRPTASGYALLLRWYREFSKRQRRAWWPWSASLTLHERRMRDMWQR